MKKEIYMMFKVGSIWIFGMAYIIIDLLWLAFFGMPWVILVAI